MGRDKYSKRDPKWYEYANKKKDYSRMKNDFNDGWVESAETRRRVDSLLPVEAYKFMNDHITPKILEVIEECFSNGVSEQMIADIVSDGVNLPESIKQFFIKALQHYKFIWQVKNDLI